MGKGIARMKENVKTQSINPEMPVSFDWEIQEKKIEKNKVEEGQKKNREK